MVECGKFLCALLKMASVPDFVIHHKDILGSGSYGKVCKAKWGQLPCAAKLLHDSLIQYCFSYAGNRIVAKFQQECQFLSTIQHPNIVQYLATVTDSQSPWPALLMELMDESLTKFLGRSTGPLPYHSQLNICYDVALALSYLHSLRPNAIIHRDLSSNNVLLIGEGSRAKVTDFGMSKLVDMFSKQPPPPGTVAPQLLTGAASLGTVPPQPMTQYPGTLVYMPPEASVDNYTTMLDCFSFGVLTIQILTKNFPNPGPRIVHNTIWTVPINVVSIPICEVDRRRNDIVLVDQSHSLRPMALACLKDRDTERPTADQLCDNLASLKTEQDYTRSVQRTQGELQRIKADLDRAKQLLGSCGILF